MLVLVLGPFVVAWCGEWRPWYPPMLAFMCQTPVTHATTTTTTPPFPQLRTSNSQRPDTGNVVADFLPFEEASEEGEIVDEVSARAKKKQERKLRKKGGKQRKRGGNDPAEMYPWIPASGYNTHNAALDLHLEILDFCTYMLPTPAEKAMRVDVVARVSEVVLAIWPNATVELFGSNETGLCLPTSDVDMVVVESSIGSSMPRGRGGGGWRCEVML